VLRIISFSDNAISQDFVCELVQPAFNLPVRLVVYSTTPAFSSTREASSTVSSTVSPTGISKNPSSNAPQQPITTTPMDSDLPTSINPPTTKLKSPEAFASSSRVTFASLF